MAMYDENCFERWSDRMEMDYISRQEEEEETHVCYGCGGDAEVEVDGDWFCEECLESVEE